VLSPGLLRALAPLAADLSAARWLERVGASSKAHVIASVTAFLSDKTNGSKNANGSKGQPRGGPAETSGTTSGSGGASGTSLGSGDESLVLSIRASLPTIILPANATFRDRDSALLVLHLGVVSAGEAPGDVETGRGVTSEEGRADVDEGHGVVQSGQGVVLEHTGVLVCSRREDWYIERVLY